MMSGVLSRWESSGFRLSLIGNSENRRVIDFQDSVVSLGFPRPPCLSYEKILDEPDALESIAGDLVRIDSPGENEGVAKRLIALGGGPPDAGLAFGEIAYLKQYHLGFCALLHWMERSGMECTIAPSEIQTMFDKWASHLRFEANGIARPPSELAPASVLEFRNLMRQRRSGRLFLKPLHGSSGSGVCAFRWTENREQLIAPIVIERRSGRTIFSNSLRVVSYQSMAEIDAILGHLLPQGMIAEQWIPKLHLANGAVDLRVLVIAGEARHWVIRQSRSPMTNLHLGNQRGSPDELRNALGSAGLAQAFSLAEDAAACFPRALYTGVDILISNRHQLLVGEINAFGDLLPNLTHRDESAYEAIARACYAKCCSV